MPCPGSFKGVGSKRQGPERWVQKMSEVARETVVVIPAYQAERTIGQVVSEVRQLGLATIVVDDASRDLTGPRAQAAGAQVIRMPVNRGKGNALREGLDRALAGDCRWVLTMDADGQHLPKEIPRFLEAAAQRVGEILIGNRMENPRGMPPDRWLTNWGMSWLLSRMAGVRIPDSQCGFRMIAREVLERLELSANRFEIESELVVKGARAGFRIATIPVSSVYQRSLSFIQPVADTLRFFRFLRSCRRGVKSGS